MTFCSFLSRLAVVLCALALFSGCQAFRMETRTDARPAAEFQPRVPALLEPLLEDTDLQKFTESHSAGNTTTTTVYQDKILLVKKQARSETFDALIKRLEADGVRPTSASQNLAAGDVHVVRLSYVNFSHLSDNGTMQYLGLVGTAFCVLCPPAALSALYPILVPATSEEKIGVIARVYRLPAADLTPRFVDTAGGIHPMVDTQGLRPVFQKEYELAWTSTHGVFAGPSEQQSFDAMREELSPRLREMVLDALGRAEGHSAPPPGGNGAAASQHGY